MVSIGDQTTTHLPPFHTQFGMMISVTTALANWLNWSCEFMEEEASINSRISSVMKLHKVHGQKSKRSA